MTSQLAFHLMAASVANGPIQLAIGSKATSGIVRQIEFRVLHFVLAESQLAALEKAKAGKDVQGEFETECLGLCGARDTFHVGSQKGIGRVYRQTFIDTYAKAGFAKLHDRKTPIMAADLRNGRVLPFQMESGAVPRRVLTDRGTE